MSDYNAYGELYDQRPSLIINERLRHCRTVRELVDLASEQDFKIAFQRGPLRQDLMIKWHENDGRRPENYSLAAGLRYMKNIKKN